MKENDQKALVFLAETAGGSRLGRRGYIYISSIDRGGAFSLICIDLYWFLYENVKKALVFV